MERHNENAQALAEFLAAHPKVTQVHYPGLPIASASRAGQRQMRGFGGLISFDARLAREGAHAAESVQLMALAESLGGVETLISHPATMTHASVPADSAQRSA